MLKQAKQVLGRVRHSRPVRIAQSVPATMGARFQMARGTTRINAEICGRMGMGGMLSNAVQMAWLAERSGIDVSFSFTNNLYAAPDGSPDWLPAFFERHDEGVGEPAIPLKINQRWDYLCLGSGLNLTLQDGHRLFHKYLGFNEAMRNMAVGFAKTHSLGESLGVHFRGTDKVREARQSSHQQMLDMIAFRLRDRHFAGIFLATDEPAFEDAVRSTFPETPVSSYNEAALSRSDGPIHFSGGDGFLKGREAVLNMMLLSNCAELVRTPSLLSGWAQVLSPQMPTQIINADGSRTATFPDGLLCRQSAR